MFQVIRTTRVALALAAAAALVAGPVSSATASPVPEPSSTMSTQAAWQDVANEIAAEARSTNSLAARRMLHSELTMVMGCHHDW